MRRDIMTVMIASLAMIFASVLTVRYLGTNYLAAALLLPFIPPLIYLSTRKDTLGCRPQILIDEFPTVVGMFSTALTSGGSFEGTVRCIATEGPKNTARLFSRVVVEADCREDPDIRGGIVSLFSRTPSVLSDTRRAMSIVMAAFDSANPVESRMMMEDAEDMALESLRGMGQSYSSGLSTPCMMIFGLGIMVPMMLISFFPVLGMGGAFHISSIDPDVLTFITVVAIPAVVLSVILTIRGRNPFPMGRVKGAHLVPMVPMLFSVPMCAMLMGGGTGLTDSILISASVCSIVSLVWMAPSLKAERRRCIREQALGDSLFELGNRLMTGENFANAVIGALRSRQDIPDLSSGLERELMLCRGDIGAALMKSLSPISDEMAKHYQEVFRASRKDIRESGGLALSIAHQVQDRNSVRKDIGNRLRSMMDMTTGTSAVFAPLILGMSIVMLGPISEISGAVMWDVSPLLLVYLIELAALISALSANLMCRGDILTVQSRFCITVPVSLIVFRICSSFSI